MLVAQRVFSMADVRLVEEAKDALKKAQRDALTKTVHPPGALPIGPRGSCGSCCAARSSVCALDQNGPCLPSSPA